MWLWRARCAWPGWCFTGTHQPLSLLHCHQREKLETGLTHANYVNNYSAFEMPAAGSDWSDHFLQSPEPGEMTQALSGFPHQARGDKVWEHIHTSWHALTSSTYTNVKLRKLLRFDALLCLLTVTWTSPDLHLTWPWTWAWQYTLQRSEHEIKFISRTQLQNSKVRL